MKRLLFVLLIALLAGCKKDNETTPESKVFKIEASGSAYSVSLFQAGATTPFASSGQKSGAYTYEFTPESGQTISLYLNATQQPFEARVTYKGQIIVYNNSGVHEFKISN